jgi:hypothetical protein
MVKGSRDAGVSRKSKVKRMRSDVQGNASEGEAAYVDFRIQSEIGKHLRAMYDDVIKEPVPTRIMELLEKLEQSTTRKT